MRRREFPLGDVLSVVKGRLLSRSDRPIEAVYELLEFMTGSCINRAQFFPATKMCCPALLGQHPQLGGMEVPRFDGYEQFVEWMTEQERRFGPIVVEGLEECSEVSGELSWDV